MRMHLKGIQKARKAYQESTGWTAPPKPKGKGQEDEDEDDEDEQENLTVRESPEPEEELRKCLFFSATNY